MSFKYIKFYDLAAEPVTTSGAASAETFSSIFANAKPEDIKTFSDSQMRQMESQAASEAPSQESAPAKPAVAPAPVIEATPVVPASQPAAQAPPKTEVPVQPTVPAQAVITTPVAHPPVTKTRDEILREQGLDEYAINFLKYREANGDVTPYIRAKSVDYTKMSHEELMRDELQRQYPQLSSEEVNALYLNDVVDRLKLDPEAGHDAIMVNIGKAKLAKEAEAIRQQRIEDQKKFDIPATDPKAQFEQQQAAEQQRRIQEAESDKNAFTTSTAGQDLVTNKRVVYDTGDGAQFQFVPDNPADVVDVLLGGKIVQHLTTPDGKPDYAKVARASAYIANEGKFLKDMWNAAKSAGSAALVNEKLVNAVPPGATSVSISPEGDVWDALKNRGVKGKAG